ncbi:unnamed protein product [Angiostrongylus costaricensis]|uniref:PHD-type domain-containing protein n=1 Tax=Angiostrongylus costaricensis TaxID=334426 RepID=A0A158PJM6_ANGCS|nr:unnamed protein product [Angiostrongylus costaricensis]
MAIRCSDPQQSFFADLMKILLSARTDRADEEDGDEADLTSKDEIALIQLQNCDPDHKIHGERIREMNYLHEEIRLTHGQSIRHIPTDWMTLTESIRLVLLTSGYYTGQSTHRHRLFSRGNYKGFKGTVFDLTPEERLEIMKVVIYQLLSYNKVINDYLLCWLHKSFARFSECDTSSFVVVKMIACSTNGQFSLLFMVSHPDPAKMPSGVDWIVEMRELLLDLEEKVCCLDFLPITNSNLCFVTWRQLLLETGDVSSLMNQDVVVKGPQGQADVMLTVAFLQLVQCISLKFFQKPFNGRNIVMATPVFLRWQKALLRCDSIPAICLFLSTLEPAIMWDKSRLQARCRACRRKAIAESLVLCADCDRCYHFECARLELGLPPLDWCCTDCKANRRKIAAAEKRRAQKGETKRCFSMSLEECTVFLRFFFMMILDMDEYMGSPQRTFAPILRDADLTSRARIEALEKLIREAMREPYAWPFLEPVDKRDVPDYYDVITRPMDLRTMINKIKQHVYDTPEEVRSDAYLIVANCKEYNEEGSEIYNVGVFFRSVLYQES